MSSQTSKCCTGTNVGIGRTYKSGITRGNINLPNTQAGTRLIPANNQPWAQYHQPNRVARPVAKHLVSQKSAEFLESAPLNFMPQE